MSLLVGKEDAYEHIKDEKVVIQFQNVGAAPPMKNNKFKLKTSARFEKIQHFVSKQLKVAGGEKMYYFINSCFQPNPDDPILDLFLAHHQNGILIVHYSPSIAWG